MVLQDEPCHRAIHRTGVYVNETEPVRELARDAAFSRSGRTIDRHNPMSIFLSILCSHFRICRASTFARKRRNFLARIERKASEMNPRSLPLFKRSRYERSNDRCAGAYSLRIYKL